MRDHRRLNPDIATEELTETPVPGRATADLIAASEHEPALFCSLCYAAWLPPKCPRCGGAVATTRVTWPGTDR